LALYPLNLLMQYHLSLDIKNGIEISDGKKIIPIFAIIKTHSHGKEN
jgi:hypothetical protein